ncbi:PREDICTED: uncharacterized abhydrolase domain-containing protein DDB_G0269086-like isoform X2 [Nicrophorus vespilloides]|uniref:Uncharacterized abhydrolase domain-containing protein DDB_G0269086-like isoform X2 n=1 Tax=Nicrophorus vespilloides TaxID=110193 RepID=A0ABM1MKV3_NICVS|nr:PREDICTED: uncharacterized abhydrolase domain-containing protein DDB_G0269086-like isoform X2 [Nicrophorus vespilloides]
MVYETDFYTTRRPYRTTPSLSTYTISSEPSRQVRLLPGLGKVHVVHTYDRIVPYVGHKRLTVVPSSPVVVRLRPSTLYREFDRIENKLRPITYNSYTNDYLNSNSHVRIVYVRNPISSSYPTIYRPSTLYTTRYYPSYASYNYYPSYLSYYYPAYYPSAPTSRFYSTYSFYPSYRWTDLSLYPSWRYNHFLRMFDDETRLIRAQTASLLQRVHNPVPRRPRAFPLPYVSRYEEVPARLSNDNYIHRMLISSPSSKSEYTTYHSDPVRKYFGLGRLACVTLVGDKPQPRRRNVYMYEDPVRNDIQLLSYYITKFRDEKAALAKPIKVPKPLEDTASEEIKKVKEERAARFSKITEFEPDTKPKQDEQVRSKRAAEAEAKAKAQIEAEAQAKKEAEAAAQKAKEEKAAAEAAKKAQEEAELKAKEEAAKKEKEAKEAAARAAELEKQAEKARLDELAKQAELERIKQEEEEKARLEEEKRRADELKAEEEKQQLLRLEEIARQAEEEKEAELARQAEELAELARQEAELAEQAKKEMEEAEEIRKSEEQAELEKKQAELDELSKIAQQDAELAEEAKIAAEEAQKEAEEAEQQISEAVVDEDVPHQEEDVPVTEEETTVVEEETPIVEEEIPVVEEETPVVEEETPTVEESEEVIEESAPEVNEVQDDEE